jgi:hypothetical protein
MFLHRFRKPDALAPVDGLARELSREGLLRADGPLIEKLSRT